MKLIKKFALFAMRACCWLMFTQVCSFFSVELLTSPSCLSLYQCMGIPILGAGFCSSWWTSWGVCWPNSQISQGVSRLKLCHSLCQSLSLICDFAENTWCVTTQVTGEESEQHVPQCGCTEYKTILLITLHQPDIKPLIAVLSVYQSRQVSSSPFLLLTPPELKKKNTVRRSVKSLHWNQCLLKTSLSPYPHHQLFFYRRLSGWLNKTCPS